MSVALIGTWGGAASMITPLKPGTSSELSNVLTAKGGRFDPSSETMVTHTLRAEGSDASEDGTGRGVPLVTMAFAQNQRDELRDLNGVAGSLAAEPGMKQQTYVSFKESQSGTRCGEVHATLDSNKGSRRMGVIQGGVRRLTPRECERLQSFPDDWTRWGEDGEEISDSARYRMLGNAVTVNAVYWLAKRIEEMEVKPWE